MRVVAILAAILVGGCAARAAEGRVTTPPPAGDPAWATTGHDPALGPGHVEAVGLGTTPEAARAEANERLVEAVYGAEAVAWGFRLPAVLREGEARVREVRLQDGRAAVHLAISKERVEAVLNELSEMPSSLPEATTVVTESLRRLDALRRARLVCERRRALLGASCESPEVEPARASLLELARSLSIRTHPAETVPVDAGGAPVTDLVVRLTAYDGERDAPVAGMPLRLVGADAAFEPSATTDSEGVARFARLEGGVIRPGAVEIAIDAEAAFGVEAEHLDLPRLPLRARPVSARRVAIFTRERAHGAESSQSRVAIGFRRILGQVDGAHVRSLDAAIGLPLIGAETVGAATRDQLAAAYTGSVDVLVIGEVESEFASRMGANTVWYQARFRGAVYDLWTGLRLRELRVDATASGLGDSRADEAARAALAEKLAETVLHGADRE